jgi:hypothetical protein
MVAFEVLLSDLMGIKTFPVISWLVLDQSVDKALKRLFVFVVKSVVRCNHSQWLFGKQ